MITETLINFFTFVAQIIMNTITDLQPGMDIGSNMVYFTAEIIKICTQATNFMHFMLGDFITIILPPTVALLVYKYTAYPILVFIRSIFVNGNY